MSATAGQEGQVPAAAGGSVPVRRPSQERPNQRVLIIAGVAVAVAGLAAWMFISSARNKEAFANRELIRARAAAEQGNLPLAASELQKIIDTYHGTDAAQNAVISLNQVRLINGQTDLAVVNLREFLAGKPEPKFVTPAQGMLGAALETAGRPGDAAEAYNRASAATDVKYLKAEYLIDAGRAFRDAGKPDSAVLAYKTVVTDYSETPSLTEAKVRLAELTQGQMAGTEPTPGS